MDFDPRDSDTPETAIRAGQIGNAPPQTARRRSATFSRDLDLPRGPDRELVRDRDRAYTLRGSESRTLATVGAFRVVSSRDLRDGRDRPLDPRSGDLRHLHEQRVGGSRTRGRLTGIRGRADEGRQEPSRTPSRP
jgi:hypothetical protein